MMTPEHTVIAEQTLPSADHDRVEHQPELVDQAVLEQGLHQLAAADHVQVPAVLLLQSDDGLGVEVANLPAAVLEAPGLVLIRLASRPSSPRTGMVA
jgi:hypothetical protein